MIIKKIEIIGYGKWVNTTFEFSNHLQIIQGRNESGKSTLRAVVEHLLFGFPRKVEGRYLYQPLTGEVMGGRLWLEQTPFGEVMVERLLVQGKVSEKMITAEGRILTTDEWQEVLDKLTYQQYQQVFAFNEQELQQLQLRSPEEIDRYLYSVSLSGSERYLQLEQQFRKTAEQQFTPKASKKELNRQLVQLEDAWQEVQQSSQQNQQYQQLVQAIQQTEATTEELQLQMAQLTAKIQKLQKLQELWPIYQDYQALAEQFALEQSAWNPQWESQLERLTVEQAWLQKTIRIQQQAAEQVRSEQQLAQEYSPLQVELRKFVQQNEVAIEQLISKMQQANVRLQQLVEEIQLEEQFWQVNRQAMPSALQANEVAKLQAWAQTIEHYTLQQQQLHQKRQVIEQQQQRLEAQYPLRGHKKQQRLWQISGLAGVIVLLSLSSLPGWSRTLLAILLGGLIWITPHTSLFKRFDRANFIEEEWRHLEEEKRACQQQLERLSKEIQHVQQQQVEWYEQSDFAKTAISLEALRKGDPLQVLRELITEWKVLQEQAQNEQDELHNYADHWQWYWQVQKLVAPKSLGQQWKVIRNAIHQLEQKPQTELVHYQKIDELQRQILELQARLSQTEHEVVMLLQQAQVDTVEAFWDKSHAYQEQQILKQRYTQYQQLLSGELQVLSQLNAEAELLAQMKQVTEQLETLSSKYHQTLKESARLQEKREQLERGVDSQQALLNYQLLKEEVRRQVVQWSSYHYAASWLMDSLQAHIPTNQQQILSDAEVFLAKLTNQRYQQLRFVEEKVQIVRQDGALLSLQQCSRGTIDQVYVAIRLAFVKNLHHTLQMPVIIDDGFVNFDLERKQFMLELLEELGQQIQILYFTLDDEMLHYNGAVIHLSERESEEKNDEKII